MKRHFPNESIVFLKNMAVGTVITDQIDANIEEVIATGFYADFHCLLPPNFTEDDTEILLQLAAKRATANVHVFACKNVVSAAFLQTLSKSLEAMAEKKAKWIVASGKWIQHMAENKLKFKSVDLTIHENKVSKKEERRKKATIGKAGGGSQGRETKTKSTKKKYLQKKIVESDSDEATSDAAAGRGEIVLITKQEVEEEITKNTGKYMIHDLCLAEHLAHYLQPNLNKLALSLAEQLGQSYKTTNLSETEERQNVLITSVRIFDKGIKHLDKADQVPLAKYLLKTLGVDFATNIFKLAAQQNMLQVAENLTTEARQKLLLDLPADVKEALSAVHRTVTRDSVEDFLSTVDDAMAVCCLVLKKYDKKKERPQVLAHKEALLEELNTTQDPALALHLATSVLFTAVTQSALHMSGRHVASVLAFLQKQLEPDTMSTLSRYHGI